MLTTALYYPYIRIPDDEWIRATLLLWDQVAAIVPGGTENLAGPLAAELRESGHVRFIDPMDHYEVLGDRDYAANFKKLMSREEIREYLASDTLGHVTGMHTSSFEDHKTIHKHKLSMSVVEYLKDEHGAKVKGEWIECDPKVADVYMTYLAGQLAGVWHESPLTDVTELDELRDTVADVLSQGDKRKAQSTVTAVLEANVPRIPADYPIDDVLEFKKLHRKPYASLRNRLINLRASLAKQNTANDLEVALENFKYGMDSAVDELSELANEQKWDVVHATVRTTFSVSGVVAGLLLAVDPTPGKVAGFGTAGAILAYKFGEELRRLRLEKRKTLYDNDFAYVHLLRREFGGADDEDEES